jgi:hypothetical protein
MTQRHLQAPLILALFTFMLQVTWTQPAAATEVRVTLLGQPCMLQGPYSEESLKLIHTLGPAQIYPNLSTPDVPGTEGQVQASLAKLHNIKNLPNVLDRYREQLTLRLQHQLLFLRSLQGGQPAAALLKLGKTVLKDQELKKYEIIGKKLALLTKGTPAFHSTIEDLFESFNEGIEPDPEPEFHRAIKKLKIQYNCSFEENDESPLISSPSAP